MRLRLSLCIALAASLTTAAALAAAPLRAFLARNGEQPGFTIIQPPAAFSTARAWLVRGEEKDGRLRSDTARLNREGFVRAVVEETRYRAAPSSGGGLSWAMELGSQGSARSELHTSLHQDIAALGAGATVHHFGVSGVPGASGWSAAVPSRPGQAANILFTEGRCLLLVGYAVPKGDPAAPARAAATAIYRRTKGICP